MDKFLNSIWFSEKIYWSFLWSRSMKQSWIVSCVCEIILLICWVLRPGKLMRTYRIEENEKKRMCLVELGKRFQKKTALTWIDVNAAENGPLEGAPTYRSTHRRKSSQGNFTSVISCFFFSSSLATFATTSGFAVPRPGVVRPPRLPSKFER